MKKSRGKGKKLSGLAITGLVILAALMIVGGVFTIRERVRKNRQTAANRNSGYGSLKSMLEVPNENIPLCEIDKTLIATDENGYKVYPSNGDRISLTGIDVSKWNGDIDWRKVKEAGMEFAMIRLGNSLVNSGDIKADPRYDEYMQGALEAGLKVGVYYYTQAITVEEALAEADFCIEKLRGYDVSFPVAFDTERYDGSARADNIDKGARTEIALSFMNRIKEAGYTPAIYMNTSWSLTGIDLEELIDYDLWYAYYGDDLFWPYRFRMWQYTENARIPGIEGNVDLNIAFPDLP